MEISYAEEMELMSDVYVPCYLLYSSSHKISSSELRLRVNSCSSLARFIVLLWLSFLVNESLELFFRNNRVQSPIYLISQY